VASGDGMKSLRSTLERLAHAVLHTKGTAPVALIVGVTGLGLLVGLDSLVMDEPVPRGDDEIYERMAEDPFGTHTFPFAYRIAVPWLVHVLPLGHTFSFSVLAWLFSASAGAVLFILLERLGFSRTISIPFALILVVSPPLLVASLRQGRSADPLTVLVMVTGALFIVERRSRALAATMLIGAFNRESALFLAPWAYAVWARDWWDGDAFRRVVAVALPAALAYASLRLAIPTVGREQVPGYGSLVGSRWDVIRDALTTLPTLARRAFTTFGPFWFVAPLALRDWSFARRSLVLAALCAMSMTFALDWQRVVLIAAPAVYASAAWSVRHSTRLLAVVLAAWLALIGGYAIYMDRSGVRTGIIENSPPRYPVR
jgi:hypothetical protein